MIAATVVLLAGLVLVFLRGGFGAQRSARLQTGWLQVTTTPGRLRSARRVAWRSRLRGRESEVNAESGAAPRAGVRERRRRRGASAADDPAEIERQVREQLYGRRGASG